MTSNGISTVLFLRNDTQDDINSVFDDVFDRFSRPGLLAMLGECLEYPVTIIIGSVVSGINAGQEHRNHYHWD